MAGLTNRSGRSISTINITPFVDVVLVLLVVLMATAIQIVRGAIEVELPKAASAGQAVESTLNIVISAQGAMFLDGAPIDNKALSSAVSKEVASNPKVQVVIAGDKAVAYERVIQVIDLVKVLGVQNFALNIERSEAAQNGP